MEYRDILSTMITAVIVPGLLWLGKQAAVYLREKCKNDMLDKYLRIASECIVDAVAQVSQTFVDKVTEGKWNVTAKNEAFELARITAMENLGITGQKLITEALGDFDKWVATKIEAEVKRLAVKQ